MSLKWLEWAQQLQTIAQNGEMSLGKAAQCHIFVQNFGLHYPQGDRPNQVIRHC